MKMVLLNVKRLTKKMLENNVKLRILGSRKRLSEEVLEAVDEAEESTKDCDKGEMGVCFNYGGREEIVQAVNKFIADGGSEISEEKMAENLYGAEIPDCDMIIRTSGEERISGFMLWRAAYSEFLFLDKKWPDMERADVGMILDEFAGRQRRFGK